MNEIKQETNSTATEILQDLTYAVIAVSVATSLMINPALLWNLLSTLDIIKFLPLTKNKMTPKIRQICAAVSIINPEPNFLEKYMNQNSSSTPNKEVQDCQIEYSPFLMNSAKELVILVFFIAVYPILCLLHHILKNYSESFSKKIMKVIKNYKYNFFIRFFLQMHLTFGVYGVVQLQSVSFT